MRLLVEVIVNNIEAQNYLEVSLWVFAYPVVFFGLSIVWRLSGVTGVRWLLGVARSSVNVLTEYVNRHSHAYFSNRFAGSISNKINNVARANEEFAILFLWSYLESGIPLVVTGIIFLATDLVVGVLYFGLIIFSVIVNMLLLPRKRGFSLELAQSQSKTTGYLVDIFTNIQAVRQYTKIKEERVNVREQTSDVYRKGTRSFLYSEYMMVINSLIFTGFAVIMFSVMIDRWLMGEITSGRLLSFILLLTYTSHMVIFLGRILSNTAKMYGQAQEGLDETLINHEIIDAPGAPELVGAGGKVVWHDATFEYGENAVFNNFNLTIEPGQRVGLVGPSGAGKTTFVSLLLRQHDLDSGVIEIDGQNIATVTQDSLREHIAVVPQEPLLFHRTIHENIAYGKPDATEEEIIEVAKKAQAHDFISELPEGYDTLVGERGVKLSGGQKQRVAIARAMLKDAPILVLDEATSALDSESEVAIQKALHELMAGKTVVAIAHRLSTLREMDRILVLEAGQIVEDGTHTDLAHAGGTYQRLWEHQAGGFLQE
ncbi:ABC transporter ATP-binding protein [bacterium]|nr:ABC transporter ATP-binding protein [bacterium]|tara:strand:+ start:4794 stop:6419 length:1626 start_codon:yes stop_codon:yes gene_type:complete